MYFVGTSRNQISNKHRPIYILLLIVLILGMIAGACLVYFFDFKQLYQLELLHQNYIITGSVKVSKLFLKNIRFPLVLYLVLFICGFSAVLQPIELFTVFLSGAACGLSVAYYYSYFGLRGVFISLLLVVPFFLLKSLLLIVLTHSSMQLSGFIGKALRGIYDDNETAVKYYCRKFMVMIVITVLVCAIQSLAISALRGIL